MLARWSDLTPIGLEYSLSGLDAIAPSAEIEIIRESTFMFMGKLKIGRDRSWRRYNFYRASRAYSFLHWAAYWSQASYVSFILDRESDTRIHDGKDLSLLLTAAVGTDVDSVKMLLQHGWHPNDLIEIEPMDNTSTHGDMILTTVWMVFLRDFGNNVVGYCRKRRLKQPWPGHLDDEWLIRTAAIVEVFLKAGADSEMYFDIRIKTGTSTYVVSLVQMLGTFKPKNQATVKWLIDRGQDGSRTAVRSTLGRVNFQATTTVDVLLRNDWYIIGVASPRGGLRSWDTCMLNGDFDVRVF